MTSLVETAARSMRLVAIGEDRRAAGGVSTTRSTCPRRALPTQKCRVRHSAPLTFAGPQPPRLQVAAEDEAPGHRIGAAAIQGDIDAFDAQVESALGAAVALGQ